MKSDKAPVDIIVNGHVLNDKDTLSPKMHANEERKVTFEIYNHSTTHHLINVKLQTNLPRTTYMFTPPRDILPERHAPAVMTLIGPALFDRALPADLKTNITYDLVRYVESG